MEKILERKINWQNNSYLQHSHEKVPSLERNYQVALHRVKNRYNAILANKISNSEENQEEFLYLIMKLEVAFNASIRNEKYQIIRDKSLYESLQDFPLHIVKFCMIEWMKNERSFPQLKDLIEVTKNETQKILYKKEKLSKLLENIK